MIDFEIVSEITDIEKIAAGTGVRDRARLKKHYGKGRWRKLKGIALVKLMSGRIRLGEIHWVRSSWHRQEGIQAKVAVSRLI